MEKQAPSIFNDVIGPVMRGPSSSHVAGAARIGDLLRQMAEGDLKEVIVDFDVNGSLAESHEGHGTDMGFACGILGVPLTDPRVDRYEELVRESGIDLQYRILDYGAEHPNHYRICAQTGKGETIRMDAISTGGGMIVMVALEGCPVSVLGDSCESFFLLQAGESETSAVTEEMEKLSPQIGSLEQFMVTAGAGICAVDVKTAVPLTEEERKCVEGALEKRWTLTGKYFMEPILPTHSSAGKAVPFRNASELLEYNKDKNLPLWELAVLYESVRGNTTKERVMKQMRGLVKIMDQAAKEGLAGTEYADRILHVQANKVDANTEKLVPGSVMNDIIKYITAIMEAKSSMKVIVAAPTAGSCGCLPGTLLALEHSLGLDREETVRGMFAAGMVGAIFAELATFAAEVGGCQMECGAGSGMAAAGVTQMMGGTAEECLDAASVALQGLSGLACDPVANRVEVPCLNKNIVGGMNAVSSTNMVLAGFDRVIPLDETIRAMLDIGQKLPLELRCTFGGLGKTETSLRIRKEMELRRK